MLTIASRLDVMNRLGRAMADPSRSRILLSMLDAPGSPARLAEHLNLTRSNAVDDAAPCTDSSCQAPGCCEHPAQTAR